jgi:hypothetical protein
MPVSNTSFNARRTATVAKVDAAPQSTLVISYVRNEAMRESFKLVDEANFGFDGNWTINQFLGSFVAKTKYRPASVSDVDGVYTITLRQKAAK